MNGILFFDLLIDRYWIKNKIWMDNSIDAASARENGPRGNPVRIRNEPVTVTASFPPDSHWPKA